MRPNRGMSISIEVAVVVPRSRRLAAEIVSVSALDRTTLDGMWMVFSRYYAEVTRERFERDLSNKRDVILLRDSGDHSVQGFSTLQVYDRVYRGRSCLTVFSGDTVIDEEYWGQSALHRAFVRYVVLLKLRNPHRPVYWFLISKGYKTYLLLSRNFTTYFPRHDRETPAWERAMIASLARDKYGEAFDETAGVLRFPECEGKLKEGVAPIEAALLEADDIRFFAERNPGHVDGDELCCLGRVDLGLWAKFTARVLSKALRGGARRLGAGAPVGR
jgi:hypothetical protein